MDETTWSDELVRGSAQALHDLLPDEPWSRQWVELEPTRPALVLGSTQPEADIDLDRAEAAGVDVARRRSGGGAVWLAVGDTLWIDVFLPKGDPLWVDDVSTSARWLGQVWARVLESVGIEDATVHEGALVCSLDSKRICFAGVGPSEVLAGPGKVVGISQRRSRAGARFQCAVLLRWEPDEWTDLLAQPPLDSLSAVGTPVGVERAAIVAAFRREIRLVERLP